MFNFRNKLTSSAIALVLLFLIQGVSSTVFADPLTPESINKFLQNADTYSDASFMKANDKLLENYMLDKIQNCVDTKFKPFVDSPRNTDAQTSAMGRKMIIFRAECRLQFFKENAAYQKTAEENAHKEVTKLFATSADAVTPEVAKKSVLAAMLLVPGRKVRDINISVVNVTRENYNDKRDYKTTWIFENNGGIGSVEEALNKVDPVEVYRAAKWVLLVSDGVWTKKTEYYSF